MSNKNLHKAKKKKNDEFYTQLTDIENELKYYREHFKGKVVYCNCDDPRVSNFFHFFSYGFKFLGLKKLIATCYKNQDMNLFSEGDKEKAIYLEYNGFRKGDVVPKIEDIGIHYLEGDGDFRSKESIELLKQADIVVTNPPFSLFREYVSQLMEYKKKFLVIGSMNAITYKEIFPLIRDNRLWLGVTKGARTFTLPSGDTKTLGNTCWYTNLEHKKRNEEIILFRAYKGNEEDYPKYDNYDAINVDKVVDIPMDYEGVMGVPITFLDKYNPKQFEIIGIDRYVEDNSNYGHRFKIEGKEKYARVLIRNRNPKSL